MLHKILNILKIVRPHHIIKAICSPLHSLRAIKYHYRRIPERMFIEFLSGLWGCPPIMVDEAYRDFKKHQQFWESIRKDLSIYPNSYGLQMTRELPSLYLLTRLIKPNIIVETGVSAGASSSYILQALMDNKKGRLYSIDLPPENMPNGKTSGWLVPERLKSCWDLRIGDSKKLLPPLLNEVGQIDCFIHDSLHTYEHMLWEFRTAWISLCPWGLFLCHDVGANQAFFDFMKEVKISWRDYRVFHVLGGFQKPKEKINK